MKNWKPIDTAPKDGTEILICQAYNAEGRVMDEKSHALFTHRAAWWKEENEGEGEWIVYNSVPDEQPPFFEPSHWMPVPPFDGE